MDTSYKLPRLYVETLQQGGGALSEAQGHYLRNVLRLSPGDAFRVFHPDQGEFKAALPAGKKETVFVLGERLRAAAPVTRRVHLFAPILPKDRMDFMIEKAVELGTTDFHPLLSEHAQIQKINEERVRAHMIEAAEQCERMDIPTLHKTISVHDALSIAPAQCFAAIERFDAKDVSPDKSNDVAVLIGPPGGWSEKERHVLDEKATPMSLGMTVLRSETAAVAALVKLIV